MCKKSFAHPNTLKILIWACIWEAFVCVFVVKLGRIVSIVLQYFAPQLIKQYPSCLKITVRSSYGQKIEKCDQRIGSHSFHFNGRMIATYSYLNNRISWKP